MNKLLIVEDEPLYRESLYQIVRNEPDLFPIVRTAQNGQEAVSIALELKPQVALIDILMPIMDGITCARILKENLPDCSIIFLTAYDRFDYAVSGIQIGVANYLLKPLRPEEVIRALREALNKNPEAKSASLDLQEEPKLLSSEKQKIAGFVEYYIKQHYAENIHLRDLASQLGFVPSYISKIFSQTYGKSFSDYLQDYRIRLAVDLLAHSNMSIKAIGCHIGYPDPNYFNRLFKRIMHCTPAEYRKRCRQDKNTRE